MVELATVGLCLFKPDFYSAGMDCFGPFEVKVGLLWEEMGDHLQVTYHQGCEPGPSDRH